MTYSDCDPEVISTPESRLAAALGADVARHLAEVHAGFAETVERLVPIQERLSRANMESLQQHYMQINAMRNAQVQNNYAAWMAMNAQQQNPCCYGTQWGRIFFAV